MARSVPGSRARRFPPPAVPRGRVAHGIGVGDAAFFHGDVRGGRSLAEDFDVDRFEDLDIGTPALGWRVDG